MSQPAVTFIFMQVVNHLPNFLLKHKAINILCYLGIQTKITCISYNKTAKAYIDLTDPEPRNILIKEVFEPSFFSIASKLLPSNGVFFDLGANYGLCSFGLLPKHDKAKFHLFEANKKLFDTINKTINLHLDNTIFASHCCLSDKEGFSIFYLEDNQSGQSHVATNDEIGLEVKNLVLDKYCQDNKLDVVHFAKIDLEGHELPTLHGWSNSLKSHNIKAIYIEIIPENQNRYNFETNGPLKYIESLGYDLFLCKEDDFASFGERPRVYQYNGSSITLCKFRAIDYPDDYPTDILALAPINI